MFKSSPSINHLEVVELSRNIIIDFPPLDDDFRIVDDDEDVEQRLDKESIKSFFSGSFVEFSYGAILTETAGPLQLDINSQFTKETRKKPILKAKNPRHYKRDHTFKNNKKLYRNKYSIAKQNSLIQKKLEEPISFSSESAVLTSTDFSLVKGITKYCYSTKINMINDRSVKKCKNLCTNLQKIMLKCKQVSLNHIELNLKQNLGVSLTYVNPLLRISRKSSSNQLKFSLS